MAQDKDFNIEQNEGKDPSSQLENNEVSSTSPSQTPAVFASVPTKVIASKSQEIANALSDQNVRPSLAMTPNEVEEREKQKHVAKLCFAAGLARNGQLPKNHPLQQYAEAIFAELFDDKETEIIIYRSDIEPNAFCHFDNKIVLSLSVLRLLKYKESLMQLLHHEYKHYKNGHFDPVPVEGSLSRQLFSKLGRERIQEVAEADLESLFELDQKGHNVAGVFSLFESLIEYEAKKSRKGRDLSHGSLHERLVLLKSTLQIKDYKHYNPDTLTQFPPELQNPELYEGNFGFPLNKELLDVEKRFAARMKSVETMTRQELYVNLLDLEKKLEDLSAEPHAVKYREINKALTKKMRELLAARLRDEFNMNEEQCEAIFESLQFFFKKFPQRDAHSKLSEQEFLELIFSKTSGLFLEKIANNQKFRDALNSLEPINLPPEIFWCIAHHFQWLLAVLSEKAQKLPPEEQSAVKTFLHLTQTQNINPVAIVAPAPKIESIRAKFFIPDDNFNNLSPEQRKKRVMLGQFSTFFGAQGIMHIRCPDMFGVFSIAGEIKQPLCHSEKVEAYYDHHSEDIYEMKYRPKSEEEGIQLMNYVLPGNKGLAYQISKKESFTLEEIDSLCEPLKPGARISIRQFIQAYVLLENLYCHAKIQKPKLSKKALVEKILSLSQKFTTYNASILDIYPLEKMGIEDAEREGFSDKLDMDLTFLASSLELLSKFTVKEFFGFMKKVNALLNFTKESAALLASTWLQTSIKEQKITFDELREIHTEFFSPLNNEIPSHFTEVLIEALLQSIKNLKQVSNETCDQILEFFRTLGQQYSNGLFYLLLASRKQWGMETLEECVLLLKLSLLTEDSVIRNSFQTKIWKQIILLSHQKHLSVKDILAILPQDTAVPFLVFEELGEEYATTPVEFDALTEHLKTYKDAESIGKLIASDEIVNHLLKDKLNFMQILLASESDMQIKNAVLGAFSIARRTVFDVFSDVEGELDNKKLALNCSFWGSPEKILNRIENLDDFQKQALIHNLLIGENGILHSPQKIEGLVHYFFAQFVEKPSDEIEKQFIDEAQKIILLALQQAKIEDAYVIFSQLLHRRILTYDKKISWLKTESGKEMYEQFLAKSDYKEKKATEAFNIYVKGETGKTKDLATAIEKTAYLFEEKVDHSSQKVDSLGLLIEVAKALGSIGVRFLQLMGMYMEIPERYQSAIKQVYSDIEGQFKLTAYDTLKNSLTPEQLINLRLEKRKGGGSILTTYPFHTEAFHGIAKVVNPNVLAKMHTVFAVLEKAFSILNQENPEKYGPLGLMLQDIKQWILADIIQSEHLGAQEEFRAANTGAKTTDGKFQSSVPKVIFANEKVIIEEMVDGPTLQHAAELSPEDVGSIVELIRQQFYGQILAGLTHSDLHPGNFIVSPDNKIHWLDRTLLLRLAPEEQDLLIASALQPTEEKRLQTFVQKLLNFSKNANLEPEKIAIIQQELQAVKAKDHLDRIKKSMIVLRQNNVHIPLNITLALKNLLALDQMARQVLS